MAATVPVFDQIEKIAEKSRNKAETGLTASRFDDKLWPINFLIDSDSNDT